MIHLEVIFTLKSYLYLARQPKSNFYLARQPKRH